MFIVVRVKIKNNINSNFVCTQNLMLVTKLTDYGL